jgi:hypothetical protein
VTPIARRVFFMTGIRYAALLPGFAPKPSAIGLVYWLPDRVRENTLRGRAPATKHRDHLLPGGTQLQGRLVPAHPSHHPTKDVTLGAYRYNECLALPCDVECPGCHQRNTLEAEPLEVVPGDPFQYTA